MTTDDKERCPCCGEPISVNSSDCNARHEDGACPRCNAGPDLPDEQDEREIDQQLSGRWEK